MDTESDHGYFWHFSATEIVPAQNMILTGGSDSWAFLRYMIENGTPRSRRQVILYNKNGYICSSRFD